MQIVRRLVMFPPCTSKVALHRLKAIIYAAGSDGSNGRLISPDAYTWHLGMITQSDEDSSHVTPRRAVEDTMHS